MLTRECKLILPIMDGQDKNLVPYHKDLADDLLQEFGGIQRHAIEGLYIDPDTKAQYVEDSICYIVNTDFQDFYKFKQIAVKYGFICDQAAVYVCLGGNAEYLSMEHYEESTYINKITKV